MKTNEKKASFSIRFHRDGDFEILYLSRGKFVIGQPMPRILLMSLIFISLFSRGVFAHGAGADNEEHVHATLSLYEKIVDLTPEIVAETTSFPASVRVGGRNLELNGPFWQLVRGWIQLYYQELNANDEDPCLTMSAEDFQAAAEDVIAQSALQRRLGRPLRHGVEHIVVGTADIGAQLGNVALVAKATSEVAETVVSKMFGGGGMHFVCHLIDASIVFGGRHLQSFGRAFAWAPIYDSSRIAGLLKTWWMMYTLRRVQRRVRFVAGPVELNEPQILDLDKEGPGRWGGFAEKGKRRRWLEKIIRRKKPSFTLDQRRYLGKRLIRYFYLKGRRLGHSGYLKGHTPMDQNLNKNVLWILAVQENLLARGLTPKETAAGMEGSPSLADRMPAQEEIRHELVREFLSGARSEGMDAATMTGRLDLVESLLKDVEVVYDPSLPRRVRYFHASMIEQLLGGFVQNAFQSVIAEKSEIYGENWKGIWNQARLHWRAGRFAGYIFEWADALRVAATVTDPDALYSQKYEMMESLLRLMRYLQRTRVVLQAENVSDLVRFEAVAKREYQSLKTFRPWKIKKTHSRWTPWSARYPRCEQLAQEVGE